MDSSSRSVAVRLAVAVLIMLLAGIATGCGTSQPSGTHTQVPVEITQVQVQDLIGPTFVKDYERQRSLLGLPAAVDPHATARCASLGNGPSNIDADGVWSCLLSLSVNHEFQSTFAYQLLLQDDGCYAFLGSPALVGGLQLTTPSGAKAMNPLFEIDGCFNS